jgi:putative polyketide hydroxylase
VDSGRAVHALPRQRSVARAPHLWVTKSGERISTIDLIRNYTVLSGRDGGRWIQAAAGVADTFAGLPLNAYRADKDFEDPQRRFATAYGLSTKGASLVRPDGFIAWRSPDDAVDCTRALRGALAQSLGVS